MNTLKIIAIFFLIGITAFSVEAQTKESNVEKQELMMVEVYYFVGLNGIYIHHNDKETEVVEVDNSLSKKKIREQATILINELQKLYDQGWSIEAVVRSDTVTKYILKRKR